MPSEAILDKAKAPAELLHESEGPMDAAAPAATMPENPSIAPPSNRLVIAEVFADGPKESNRTSFMTKSHAPFCICWVVG